LAAPEKGQPFFAAEHYESVAGDAWAETPELTLFSGTVNRRAIAATLEEFQRREGCRITTVFEGCGTLVGMMRAGATPDAYLACDVSYVEQVSEQFRQPLPLSTNRLVLAVRTGNPAQIRNLADLTRPGVRVGLCDPQLTALGDLTVRMLQEAGALSGVQENSPRTGITGDVLVAQLLASDKLDAVIVYEANCAAARDQLEVIPIDHPRATATQPFSIHRSAAYPQLSGRLEEALAAPRSRARFEAEGFTWLNP
jgi:ABC-type molybdate transport system substrate-binding protein